MIVLHHPPNDPSEWILYAENDLEVVKQGINPSYGILCFHAQQAAEKALKAVLVHKSIDVPYIHDIGELLTALEEAGVKSDVPSPEWNRLSRYAVLTRYPGHSEEVTPEDYKEARQVAEEIVEWATSRIEKQD